MRSVLLSLLIAVFCAAICPAKADCSFYRSPDTMDVVVIARSSAPRAGLAGAVRALASVTDGGRRPCAP